MLLLRKQLYISILLDDAQKITTATHMLEHFFVKSSGSSTKTSAHIDSKFYSGLCVTVTAWEISKKHVLSGLSFA